MFWMFNLNVTWFPFSGLSTVHHNLDEHCDFCVLSFPTRPELKAHVLTHFKKKICLRTQKTLLQIADDWFELHISHGCTSEQCDSEIISTDVQISDERVKKEENPEENGIGNDGELVNVASSEPMKIESDCEPEINFDVDFDASSSESWSTSNDKKVRPFESRAKESKVDSTKHKTMPTSTDKKPRTVNGNSVTLKSTHRKSKQTKCRICKWKFAEDEMILHLQSRHVPKIDPIPTCETCGKTFSTRGNLRSHQYLHAERGRYICSYCGKEFVRNANLKEHINLHTVSRTFLFKIIEISSLLLILCLREHDHSSVKFARRLFIAKLCYETTGASTPAKRNIDAILRIVNGRICSTLIWNDISSVSMAYTRKNIRVSFVRKYFPKINYWRNILRHTKDWFFHWLEIIVATLSTCFLRLKILSRLWRTKWWHT